jgi:iron complex outermembrane receptor protein
VTKRLGDEPEAMLRADLGSYREINALGSLTLPLTDTFAVGGAVARYTRDGYGTNLTTGQEHYNKDVTAYRFSAEWTPTDDLFFRLAYDRVDDDSAPRHGHREVNSTTGGYTPPADVYDTQAGSDRRPVGDDRRRLPDRRIHPVNDTLTFKSITAYRSGDTKTVIDFDETPLPTLDIPAIYSDHQFTQEFQLLYTGERLSGVAGLFFMDATASGAFDTIAGNLGLSIAAAGSVDTKSYSAFADFSYDLSDRLHISAGGRYTRDDKDGQVLRLFYLGATRSPFTGGVDRPIFATRTNYTASKTFEKFTPRVSVSYDFSDAMTGYGSISQGFKSGGWDMRGDAALVPQTVNGYSPRRSPPMSWA